MFDYSMFIVKIPESPAISYLKHHDKRLGPLNGRRVKIIAVAQTSRSPSPASSTVKFSLHCSGSEILESRQPLRSQTRRHSRPTQAAAVCSHCKPAAVCSSVKPTSSGPRAPRCGSAPRVFCAYPHSNACSSSARFLPASPQFPLLASPLQCSPLQGPFL